MSASESEHPRGRSHLTNEAEDELKARFNLLVYEGRLVEGTSPVLDITVRPDYFDQERFMRAQKTVNKYHSSVSMASAVGLMILLQFDEILLPLIKTGKSRTVADLYERYSATGNYIVKAYESNFLELDTEGWRYINLVRSMHRRAYQLLNSPECEQLRKPKCQAKDEGKYVWINQYDMALTQFAFVGLFILRPDKCGVFDATETEMSDIVYYWRLMSHQFGIEDRFNIFAYHDDMTKEHRLLGLVLDEYREKLVSQGNPIGLDMSKSYLLSFEEMNTVTTFTILDRHWRDVISISGSKEPAPYQGLSERWKLVRFNLVFKLLLRNDVIRSYMTKMYKRKFEKFCKRREKIKKRLAKKYPLPIYEIDSSLMEMNELKTD